MNSIKKSPSVTIKKPGKQRKNKKNENGHDKGKKESNTDKTIIGDLLKENRNVKIKIRNVEESLNKKAKKAMQKKKDEIYKQTFKYKFL